LKWEHKGLRKINIPKPDGTQRSLHIPSNSHYGKSGRIMGKMKSETIKHEREKMLPAIKINVTS
jgi:hypothetical protein